MSNGYEQRKLELEKSTKGLSDGKVFALKYSGLKPYMKDEFTDSGTTDHYIRENFPNMKQWTSNYIAEINRDSTFKTLPYDQKVRIRGEITGDIIDAWGQIPEDEIISLKPTQIANEFVKKYLQKIKVEASNKKPVDTGEANPLKKKKRFSHLV
mgnify:CR=1 FL=1|tara:strand:- start:24989 stop:25450 length:462 start_codon:yes stop_codon:yes gene_type:complete